MNFQDFCEASSKQCTLKLKDCILGVSTKVSELISLNIRTDYTNSEVKAVIGDTMFILASICNISGVSIKYNIRRIDEDAEYEQEVARSEGMRQMDSSPITIAKALLESSLNFLTYSPFSEEFRDSITEVFICCQTILAANSIDEEEVYLFTLAKIQSSIKSLQDGLL